MKDEIKGILDKLQNGEISPEKALKLIKNIDIKNDFDKIKPARKIKILIIDGDDHKKIHLPGIPFGLVSFLGKLGIIIAPLAIKNNRNIDPKAREALKIIKEINLKEIFDVIKAHGSFDLVDVISENDVVKISIL